MANTACQPVEADVFSANNIKQCEKYVSSIQRKLDKAVADNDKSKIRWYTHLLSKKSRAVKVEHTGEALRLRRVSPSLYIG